MEDNILSIFNTLFTPLLLNRVDAFENIIIYDVNTMPNKEKELVSLLNALKIGSLLGVPIFSGKELYGMTALANQKSYGDWSKEHIRVIQLINKIISNYLNRVESQEKILAAFQEKEQSELKYRRLVETLRDEYFFYSHDTNGVFQYVSPSIVNVLGYTQEEFCTNCDKYLTDNPFNKEVMKNTEQSIEGVQPPPYEVEIYHKDGGIKRLEVKEAPIFKNGSRKVIAVEGIAHDITERKLMEDQIKNSLREKEVLLKEIHHRVKNNLQLISSLLYLQSEKTKDICSVNILLESQNRIKTMAMIHEGLYQSKDLSSINLGKYIRDLTGNLIHTYKEKTGDITIAYNITDVRLDVDKVIPLGLVINELFTNSLKHAFPNNDRGEIAIEFTKGEEENHYTLIVRDNGDCFPGDVDFRKTSSLGLQLVNTLITKQLRGTVELYRSKGTEFRITFKR